MALMGPRCCVDRLVEGRRAAEAARIAVAETPANRFPGAGREMAVVTAKRWRNGRTLRVSFLDSAAVAPRLKERVAHHAQSWSKYANIRFSFVGDDDPSAEIRIAFVQGDGSWSYIGTDALLPDNAGRATMNFGWLEDDSEEEEIARVVLHEFGHALGCIHEHQNPAAGIPWDRRVVYDYYMGAPNYWTSAEVDNNLFGAYDRDLTQYSEFDRDSIMLYPIEARFVTDPAYAVGLNSRLSQADKLFIASVYPRGAPAGTGAVERPPQGLEGREGYQDAFLDHGHRVAMPTLAEDLKKDLAPLADGSRGVLAYTHFSVVMSQSRRMAFYTAVNVDGTQFKPDVGREGQTWFIDPRMSREFQTGNDVYAGNALDRGHLVRRQDPVWGDDAETANTDTFSFANACPQHEGFNQVIWLSLEDYLLKGATKGDGKGKICVFTGPVFSDDDRPYRGIRLPQQFWKVVAWSRDDGTLAASGYLISQVDLLDRFLSGRVRRRKGREEMAFGAFKTYQTSLRAVEALTGLAFEDLRGSDVMGGRETVAIKEIDSEADLAF